MGTVLSSPTKERPKSDYNLASGNDNIPLERVSTSRISSSKSVMNFSEKSHVSDRSNGTGFFRNNLINSLSLKKLNINSSSATSSSVAKRKVAEKPSLISISTISNERQIYDSDGGRVKHDHILCSEDSQNNNHPPSRFLQTFNHPQFHPRCFSAENTNLIKSISCHTLKFSGTSSSDPSSGHTPPPQDRNGHLRFPNKNLIANGKENANYRYHNGRDYTLDNFDLHRLNNNIPPPTSITMPALKSVTNGSGITGSTSMQKLQKRFVIHASTSELLKCIGYFLFYACPQLTFFQPNSAVVWVKAIDRALILQGWAEIYFINPANVVFLYMLLREFADDPRRIRTERHLQCLTQICLYIAYAYMGNEISYPLKPFLLPLQPSDQLRRESVTSEKMCEDDASGIMGDEEETSEAQLDRVRDQFWVWCLDVVNKKSGDMLKINADPTYFTQMFSELKAYSVNFS